MVNNKLCVLLAVISLLAFHTISQTKMALYVFYTPSHEKLYKEWFLPSISPEDDFEVIEEMYDQECETGQYMKAGWLLTMMHKVDLVLRGIQENPDSIFIHADVDIQFFKPIKQLIVKAMEGKDMAFQKNAPNGELCAGFFACRGNSKTYELWKSIKEKLQEKLQNGRSKGANDQSLLNLLVRKTNPFNVSWDYLPDIFFGGGLLTGKSWKPGITLVIPENTVMHHANWTVGIEHKIAQLQYVRCEIVNRA